jgi:hypothetical protein
MITPPRWRASGLIRSLIERRLEMSMAAAIIAP